MVDNILEFSQKKLEIDEIKRLQDEVLKLNDPRLIFLIAKYIKGVDIELLSEAILKTNNQRYIHFFVRTIKNINYSKYIDKIIEYETPWLLYYTFYDTPELPNEEIQKIFNELNRLGDEVYLGRSLYYYFNVLNLGDNQIFLILKEFLNKLNVDISKIDIDNCKIVLEKLRKNNSKKYLVNNYNGYTENCFKGRNGFIPDLIVCHIANDYNKAINNFYDEETKTSSHFVVGREGQFKQIVSLKDSAWANGTSDKPESDVYYKFSTNNIVKDKKGNANYYSFSIEHESFDGNLTDKQYDTTLNIMKEIINFVKKEYNYDFLIDKNHIIGHNAVNPVVRTICPGPKFPFQRLINDLLIWKEKLK